MAEHVMADFRPQAPQPHRHDKSGLTSSPNRAIPLALPPPSSYHRAPRNSRACRAKMNRIFVEKRPEFNSEAKHLYHDIHSSLGIDGLEAVRVVQRYDLDGLSDDEFAAASKLILSEPQVDQVSSELILADGETAYAVEYLPGTIRSESRFRRAMCANPDR